MILQISENLAATINPWDFIVQIGGVKYRTRRPLLGHLVAMDSYGKPGGTDLAAMVRVLGELYESPGPDLADWSLEALQQFMKGYAAYFFAWSEGRAAVTGGTLVPQEGRIGSAAGNLSR
jgi:hypothetical protein